ncbi:MAG: hypothetical protein C4306_05225, partial [Thermoleophilia bacterium]
AGLGAPFVGRERELKLVKDLFQASAEAGRAHLLLVTGGVGTGKSPMTSSCSGSHGRAGEADPLLE